MLKKREKIFYLEWWVKYEHYCSGKQAYENSYYNVSNKRLGNGKILQKSNRFIVSQSCKILFCAYNSQAQPRFIF
ncbi:hypothetical protein ACWIVY_09955 [Ursidibacter sp. B-7004-1]